MERTLPLRTERTAASWLGTGLAGWLPLLGLLAWHGWLTLTLFGAENRWQQLLDNRPIVSGRHALHLYHATLGAQAQRERGSFCCFDPAFQAGYPKTAVFDAGARPAELFFLLTGKAPGSQEEPLLAAPYKIGLAICCLAAPLLLLAAVRGAGLSLGASTLALAAGILVCWGTPGRQLLEAGDLDLFLAGLATVAGAGMLIFFHRAPGFRSWLGIFAAGCLGWFTQPLLFLMLLPLALVYYTSVGCKHRLAWHVALLFALGGAFAVNCFWLLDWLAYWWIRSPLQGDVFVLAHRTFHTLWAAPLWGEPCERLFAGVLLLLAVVGLYVLNESQQRATARLFGLGAVGFSVLALAGRRLGAAGPAGRFAAAGRRSLVRYRAGGGGSGTACWSGHAPATEPAARRGPGKLPGVCPVPGGGEIFGRLRVALPGQHAVAHRPDRRAARLGEGASRKHHDGGPHSLGRGRR